MLSPRRLLILAVLIGLSITLAVARAIQVQVVENPKYVAAASYQQTQLHTTLAPRGAIYDRNGSLLAISNRAYLIRIVPIHITDTLAVANALAPALGKGIDEVFSQMKTISDSAATAAPLSTIVSYDLSPRATHQLTMTLGKLAGVTIEETWDRTYPYGPIAGPTLGFVSLQPTGYSGIEGFYDAELTSSTGQRTEKSRLDLLSVKPVHNGADVVLTLDMTLQAYVEQRLTQALHDTRAMSGTVIVMETKTGAILASASAPGYDPNRALELANSGQFGLLKDPSVSNLYEPGSVMKIATLATALDIGFITPAMVVSDTGRLVIGTKRIYNSDRVGHGNVNLETILTLSLNVPTANIALGMGPEKFYEHFKLFGFGSQSGIDLGGEDVGVLRTPSDVTWSPSDLATNSYGQGMSATPYQVASALNAIANDGMLMQPYIVREWRQADGNIVTKQPVATRRVISAETARILRDVMVAATRRGTPEALLKGYTVAGKTGTADWYKPVLVNGQLVIRKQDSTIVTYVGFVPASDPKLTILVKLDQPMSSQWAGKTTVPVFHDVAERACLIMGVAPNVALGSTPGSAPNAAAADAKRSASGLKQP